MSDLFPTAYTNPSAAPAPALYVSATWNGTYTQNTTAIFDRVVVQAASEGADTLEFETPYGHVLSGSSFSLVAPVDLVGSWVYLSLGGTNVFWGQIRGESRQTLGSDDDTGGTTATPKGFQKWTAYGGLEILRRTWVSKSYWARGGSTIEVGWTPGFNLRDSQGLYQGNRGSAVSPDDPYSYDFGDSSTWTRRQVLDYLIKRFLGTGPSWAITDPTGALNTPLRLLELGVTQSVAKVIEDVIAHQDGLDYTIVPQFSGGGAPGGYQINVFTLTPSTISFGGASIPANGSTVNFDTSLAQACESIEVVRDGTYSVSRIRLVGDRVLVCATLLGPTLAGYPGDDILTSTHASLIGKWTSTLETAYDRGDPGYGVDDDAEHHDTARAAEKFATVFQRYGLPVGWSRPTDWLPSFDSTMAFQSGTASPYQDSIRETESWLPLLEGWDYSGTPTNNNPASSVLQETKQPFAIAEDRAPTVSGGTGSVQYSTSHLLGLAHSSLKKDFGLQMHANPPHRLARTRWTSTLGGTTYASSRFNPDDGNEEKAINPNTLAVTIAWRTDVRFLLEYVVGSGDDGTVVEIPVHDAQAWVLAPNTIVDVVAGAPVYSPGTAQVLRNDASLFAPMMCGLIARYTSARARFSGAFHDWFPAWAGFVGQILHAAESGATGNTIDAPITSVEFVGGRNGQPRTSIKAGFAR